MDLQSLNKSSDDNHNGLAIAGLGFCDALRQAYNRASLELSFRVGEDPAIVPLVFFVLTYRQFYDQCLEFSQNPTEVNQIILQKYYANLNKSYQHFEEQAKIK